MTEHNHTTTAVEVDPMTKAAGGVNTDFPVLMPDRIYRFEFKGCNLKPDDAGNKKGAEIVLALQKDAQFQDGKPARAGFKVRVYSLIVPVGGYDQDSVERNWALWIKGFVGVEASRSVPLNDLYTNPSKYEGMPIDCRTGINKDKSGAYPDSTRLTPVLPS